MKWYFWTGPAVVLLISLASCSDIKTASHQESRKEAAERWGQVRARLKYQLASESFAKGQLDQAQQQAKEAIGLDPKAPESYVLIARVLLERGETAAAAEAVKTAMTNGGDTPDIDYLNGLIAQHYGQFAVALDWYRLAAQREPNDAHYVVAVAEMLVALDRAAEALTLVRSRWTDFEQNAAIRELAGGIYMMLDRYEDAADAYREASRISPNDETLPIQLGMALTRAGSFEEARTVLRAAVAKTRDVRPMVLIALARCHLSLGEMDDARAVLRRAVEAAPNSAQGWFWLARVTLASDDLMTARQAAGRAAELEPTCSDYTMLHGYVCWRQKDYTAAAAAFEKVLTDTPDEQVAWYFLGRSREALGSPQAAKRCFQYLMTANPESEWARRLAEGRAPSDDAAGRHQQLLGGKTRVP